VGADNEISVGERKQNNVEGEDRTTTIEQCASLSQAFLGGTGREISNLKDKQARRRLPLKNWKLFTGMVVVRNEEGNRTSLSIGETITEINILNLI
jgi:hypothetical protein